MDFPKKGINTIEMTFHRALLRCVFLFSIFFGTTSIQGKDLITETYLGWSTKKKPIEAKQEISKKAIEYYSLKYIKQIVGPSWNERDLSSVQDKVLNQSGKYIPFINSHNFKANENGFEMSVDVKISLKNLKDILLSEGLLYIGDGPLKILPMVTFIDEVNKIRWAWWLETTETYPDHSHLYDYGLQLENILKEAFFKKGFYSLSPLEYKFKSSLPHVLINKSLRRPNHHDITTFLGAEMVLTGKVEITQNKQVENSFDLHFQLSGIHSISRKIITSLERTYSTKSGLFQQVVPEKLLAVYPEITQNLLDQLYRVWKKGTLRTRQIQITLNGTLNHQQVRAFKKMLAAKSEWVKEVRIRRFEPSKVVLEIESEQNPQEIANHFQKIRFSKMKVEVLYLDKNEVGLKISTF